jgi:hypothetical protein
MQGNSWNDILDRTRPGSVAHVPDTLASPVASDDDAALPGSADSYKAAGTPANHSLTRLCCVMGREEFRKGGKAYRYFQYVHMESDTDLGFTEHGQVLTLRFASASKLVEIKILGRNLLRICDDIHLHRMPWIRVADRDYRAPDGEADNKPVITEIRIEEVAEPTRGE